MRLWTKAAVQGAACGLMFGLVVLIGGCLRQLATLDVVRARRFEVVDAAGKMRAGLAVQPDGSAGLRLIDAAGKARVTLGVYPDGDTALFLLDAVGKTRAGLTVNPYGPQLGLADAAGKVIWEAP